MDTCTKDTKHTVKWLTGFFSTVFFVLTLHAAAPAGQPQVAAGYLHTVGLKTDGTVVAVGQNDYGQCNVSGWTNITQVAAGYRNTVGLKSDGTVVAVGYNFAGQCDTGAWITITQVAAGDAHTVGLKADGTVVAAGDNDYGQCNVGAWTNITQVAAGEIHTVGLRTDGTVAAVGWNEYGQCDVSGWINIAQISAGSVHTVGLKTDGTVVAVGLNIHGQCTVGSWTNITQVAAGAECTVGLKTDGTVVATGKNDHGQCDVSGWTTMAQVNGGFRHTVGLKADGTVIAAGANDYGQCDVAGWNLGPTSLPPMPTGIQITGTSSNIVTSVIAGQPVTFEMNTVVQGGAPVRYQFFTRAGYGLPAWGGNAWEIVQDYSPADSVTVTFPTPGIYFLVGHIVYPGETWAFGDPQSGIVVEVSDPSGTGIQITGTSSNIVTKVMAGQPVTFSIDCFVQGGAPVHYRFFTRAGYGEPSWGGNSWAVVQNYSPADSVTVTFPTRECTFLSVTLSIPEKIGTPAILRAALSWRYGKF